MPPSFEELFAELVKLAGESRVRPEGFHTANELAEMTGRPLRTVHNLLKGAAKAGRLERSNVSIDTLSGRQTTVTGYRIKPAKRK